VAGYFYMAAYSPGSFAIIPRPVDHLAKMVSCALVEKVLTSDLTHTEQLARADFSNTGSFNDGNPCRPPCPVVPVAPTTWSRIKAHTGR